MTPIHLRPNISKTAGDAIQQQSLSLLCGSTVSCPSDSLASCFMWHTQCRKCVPKWNRVWLKIINIYYPWLTGV